jgi:hypothetical protein
MILTLIFCLGIQILMASMNLMRYYAGDEKSWLTLAVFQILLITFIVHTLSNMI